MTKNDTPPKIIGEWEVYKFERQTLSFNVKSFLLTLLITVFGLSASAQIDCTMLGMSVNVSDTDYIKLYHAGPYLLWPREHNVIYWDITDLQGGLVHLDTTYGEDAGNMGFNHIVPLSDSMIVSAIIMNDSVQDMSSGNVYPMACQNIDTLYWEPDTITPSYISYRWEFVGGSNAGVSVLWIDEKDLESTHARIYPNPASTNIFIDKLSEGLRSITIYNIHGQQIFASESIDPKIAINIESWPTGQYIIRINHRPTQLLNIIH
jgi:hypothetical protein